MPRSWRTVELLAVVTLLLAAVGCGKRGPPLAPLRPVPARVEDLTIRRLGNDVFLQFTIPSRNGDSTTPASLVRMEAFAITGKPEDPAGRSLEQADFLKYATPVAAIEVEPPPPPDPADGPAPPPLPPDPRPAQGERVTIVESLTEAAMIPFVHPKQKEFDQRRKVVEADEPHEPIPAPIMPPTVEPPGRVYVVTGRSRHKQAGPLSARLRLPLTAVPEAPIAPTVRYDAERLYLTWPAPPTAKRRIQELVTPAPMPAPVPAPATPAPVAAPVPPAATPGPPPAPPAPPTPETASPSVSAPVPAAGPAGVATEPEGVQGVATPPTPAAAAAPELPLLAGRPIFPGAIPNTYNVYEQTVTPTGSVLTMPTPVNPKPLETPSFEDARLMFGVERCYVIRMVEAHGSVTLESPPSPPTCVTPRDTFPPTAPRNLTAVGAEGIVNLIWEPNTEADFAGYVVLRGEAPGDKLTALTSTPIRETSYRDVTAKPGVSYVYAVVAVDTAVPQNVSLESNRVEEAPR
jgi:hypothetical protein